MHPAVPKRPWSSSQQRVPRVSQRVQSAPQAPSPPSRPQAPGASCSASAECPGVFNSCLGSSCSLSSPSRVPASPRSAPTLWDARRQRALGVTKKPKAGPKGSSLCPRRPNRRQRGSGQPAREQGPSILSPCQGSTGNRQRPASQGSRPAAGPGGFLCHRCTIKTVSWKGCFVVLSEWE